MIELRPYQVDALKAVHTELGQRRTSLLVMATGLGKTTVFSEFLKERNCIGRALVIAHREELITQAARRIEAQTGLSVCVEMGDSHASIMNPSRVVVASVQTLSRRKRRQKFAQDEFMTLVIDEAHHSVARGYRDIINYFSCASVLGVTATPDRTDEVALGEVFESSAYRYDIREAIDDGWLVDITQKRIYCESLDLSGVKKKGGDLSETDLQQVMTVEKGLHEIAGPLVKEAGDRRTLIFTPGVEAAHALAKIMTGYTDARIEAIDGNTPKNERREILARFDRGETQFLANCQVLTEGYDSVGISCICVCRPTTSRSLYAQMLGRGLRPSPGKTDCLVLDFAGNSGRHNLVCPADVLAGKTLDAEVKTELDALLRDVPTYGLGRATEEAEKRIAARKAQAEAIADRKRRDKEHREKVRAEARYRWEQVSPFKGSPLDNVITAPKHPAEPTMTSQQRARLTSWGIDPNKYREFQALGKWQASKAISKLEDRRKAGLCSYGQSKILTRNGYAADVTKAEASAIIDRIATEQGWKKKSA